MEAYLIPFLATVSLVLLIVVIRLWRLYHRANHPPESSAMLTGIERIEGQMRALEALSTEVSRLSGMFTLPRLRGAFGEALLANLLSAWLPSEGFTLQYGFKTGVRADAVIRMGPYLVAVDSKFPLESYQRFMDQPERDQLPGEVRRVFLKHARDIAERYIQPDENTLNFALMYIPSETVYYNIFIGHQNDLMTEILKLHVVPVSPGTLFLYLQTVSYGLRGLVLDQKGALLAGLVTQLNNDIQSIRRSYQTAETHLRNLRKVFDDHQHQIQTAEHTLRGIER